MNSNSIGLYHVTGTAGSGMPGAPLLHFDLTVLAATGAVNGFVAITQAVPPPGNEIKIRVTGIVRKIVGGAPYTQQVLLSGIYGVPVPPPRNAIVEEHFAASFRIGDDWNGLGNFEYGGREAPDVPVHRLS